MVEADRIIAAVYLVTFLILTTVVLFNVFIAILENSYDIVTHRQDRQFKTLSRVKAVMMWIKKFFEKLSGKK